MKRKPIFKVRFVRLIDEIYIEYTVCIYKPTCGSLHIIFIPISKFKELHIDPGIEFDFIQKISLNKGATEFKREVIQVCGIAAPLVLSWKYSFHIMSHMNPNN